MIIGVKKTLEGIEYADLMGADIMPDREGARLRLDQDRFVEDRFVEDPDGDWVFAAGEDRPGRFRRSAQLRDPKGAHSA